MSQTKIEFYKSCFDQGYEIDGVDMNSEHKQEFIEKIYQKLKSDSRFFNIVFSDFLSNYADIEENDMHQCGTCGDFNERIVYILEI